MGWADPAEFPDSIYGGYGLGQQQGALGGFAPGGGGGIGPAYKTTFADRAGDHKVPEYDSFKEGFEAIFGGDDWEPDMRDSNQREREDGGWSESDFGDYDVF